MGYLLHLFEVERSVWVERLFVEPIGHGQRSVGRHYALAFGEVQEAQLSAFGSTKNVAQIGFSLVLKTCLFRD